MSQPSPRSDPSSGQRVESWGTRDQMIERHMPLARRLASRFHGGQEPSDDLVQVAYLGLVRAVDRFDPAYGARFGSFAIPTITGELQRHFRDTSWALHVPRGVQEAVLRTSRAADDLTDQLGRSPTVAELARATGLDDEQVLEALQARSTQQVASLDQPLPGVAPGDVTLAEVTGRDDDRFDFVEHQATLEPSLRALPPRERKILELRFGAELTQLEIARRIGCSQMQISRILRSTIAELSRVHDERVG